jgi:hypothetical protein
VRGADVGRRFVDGVALSLWFGCTTSSLGICNVLDCGLELERLERRCVEVEWFVALLRCHHGLWRSESGTRLGVGISVIVSRHGKDSKQLFVV